MKNRGSIRKRLISLLKTPKRVMDLQKELNVSPGTISYHLKKLREEEIVDVQKEKKQGQPTTYVLKYKKDFQSGKRVRSLLNMLEQIKQQKEGLEFEQFIFPKEWVDYIDDWIDWAQDLDGWGFVSTRFHLTKKGKNFLEKMKKKYPKIKKELDEMNKEISKIDENSFKRTKSKENKQNKSRNTNKNKSLSSGGKKK